MNIALAHFVHNLAKVSIEPFLGIRCMSDSVSIVLHIQCKKRFPLIREYIQYAIKTTPYT